MTTPRRARGAALLLAGACGLSACSAAGVHGPAVSQAVSQAVPQIDAALWQRVLEAEDARIRTPEQLDVVRNALTSENDHARAMAVRALGRTERAEHAGLIGALLEDPALEVRVAAAHAIADVAGDTATAVEQRDRLLSLLLEPTDAVNAPGAADGASDDQAAIAESLGRLPADVAGAREVAARLTSLLTPGHPALTGALRGSYFLARQSAGRDVVRSVAADALRTIARSGPDARQRGLAIATLATVGAADAGTLRAALGDAEPQVRREAALAAGAIPDTAEVRQLMAGALGDTAPPVRYDALRTYARRLAATDGCEPVLRAARDTSTHVALLAISLLGTACGSPANVQLLDSLAAVGPYDDWHRPAQATVALALTDAAGAVPHVRGLANHSSPFARTYAAHAARAAGDTTLLLRLAQDTSVNVRTAAVSGLAATVGHDADSVYVAQLSTTESELLMAAAGALEGSNHAGAPDALLHALGRVTALRRETSRDGRIALLDRIAELGGPELVPRLEPYLDDFDERVAVRAAAIIEAWTGVRPPTAPQPLPPLPLPTFDDAARIARSVYVIELVNGGEVTVRLHAFDAATNAARFARLARRGWFNGLTLHRVVPNFVVQGGSPGANEYSGDGPFTRDELGSPNWRGTVGLSTRGRDTGDAQFYINLVDNVRLDHEYTVFGVVTAGLDVIDRLTEGAVIRRIRERPLR